MEDIRADHMKPKSEGGKGWSDIAYHFVLQENRLRRVGRRVPQTGTHCRPNDGKLGVCVPGDNTSEFGEPWTVGQQMDLVSLVHDLRSIFPWLEVYPHWKFKNTLCPGLDEIEWHYLEENWGGV